MHGDAGDLRAFFRAEIERLSDRLYGTALRLTRNPADAEDLVAEAVLKAWSGIARLKDRRAFAKWMFQILLNTFISERRSARSRPLAAAEHDEDGSFSLFEKLHQPFLLWWSDPERQFANGLLRRHIEEAFDGLPEEFRLVMILVEIEGCSYEETAAMLRLPVGTVRSRLHRARSLLQQALWQEAVAAGLVAARPREEHLHE